MEFGHLFKFEDVFRAEVDSINSRSSRQTRRVVLEPEPLATSDNTKPLRPTEDSNLVGLAFSGGGVRSAAVCLGALQALNEAKVLDSVDYLSTVSGGGYIGSSLTAAMSENGGTFPFESELSEDETPAVQHLRNYSNYLFPHGALDVLRNVSIYARGLVTNGILVVPYLLFAAAITVWISPNKDALSTPNVLGFPLLFNIFPLQHFVVTAYLLLFLIVLGAVWSIIKSLESGSDPEIPNTFGTFIGAVTILVLLSAFCELQPYILDGMFDQQKATFFGALSGWIQKLALALAPLAAIVAFLAKKLGEFIKSALESERVQVRLAGLAGRAAMYVAALFVPIMLWAVYLELSFWGITPYEVCPPPKPAICTPAAATSASAPDCAGILKGLVCGSANPAVCQPAKPPKHEECIKTPESLQKYANKLTASLEKLLGKPAERAPVANFYALLGLCLVPLAFFLRPNANSLHPLYRDRLARAFLFKPVDYWQGKHNLDPVRPRLSDLKEGHGPYHLINTALNVQSSATANQRGRNADFFIFSRNFVGSKVTDYVKTEDMEKVAPELDLATAMAASGAAASSNMGAATIKSLTPSLALLNIRLGYWLRNPRQVHRRARWNRLANFYFLFELLGQLNESRKSVYLTDGGHIENLGIYELLRRRCKIIIAVDAEADPQMAFGSFNVLERFARIDLGVRIDLPWQTIADVTKATGEAIDKKGDAPKRLGPHVAVGEISYPGNRRGILIYIKASLTGDENDYVFHYKKRYSRFPHETTLDQLFTEEQFEAYRALGFHATHRFFDRRDDFAHLDPTVNPDVRGDMATLDTIFPLPNGGASPWPRKHSSFADWLDEKPATS